MIDHMNALGDLWWQWTVPMFWQVALLAFVVWTLDLGLRKRGWPQVRYVLWMLVFAKLLIPPSFSLRSSVSSRIIAAAEVRFAPDVGRARTSLAASRPHHSPARPISGALPTSGGAVGSANSIQATRQPPRRLSFRAWAMMLSTGVSLLLLMGLAARLHRMRVLATRERGHAPPEWLHQLLSECAARLKLRRLPQLVVRERAENIGVFGALRPVILMPATCARMSREQAEHVLLHELAHLKRGDLLANAMQSMLLALYWFHPILWLAARRLRHLREMCCDATVSDILRERTGDYAATLVEVAAGSAARKSDPVLGLIGLFESASRLRQRVAHLGRPSWRHARLRLLLSAAAAVLMLVCVAPMAKLKTRSAVAAEAIGRTAPSAVKDKATIRGIVKRADTGAPLQGISVEIWDFRQRPAGLVAAAKSGRDGQFETTSSQTGRFTIMAYGEGWFSQFGGDVATEVELARGQAILDAVVAMVPAASLSGRVVDKETGDPIEDALVRAGRRFFSTMTDEAGKFRLANLPVGGEFGVQIAKPGYGLVMFALGLGSGQTIHREIALDREAVFVGRVTDEHGEAIVGADVNCHSRHGGSREFYDRKTDADGRYEIRCVRRGAPYRISASKRGYDTRTKEIQVPPDAETLEVDFVLDPGSDVAGEVVDESGAAMSGVRVHWGRGYGHRVVKTDATGRFSFRGLKSGHPNDVYAVKEGYAVGRQKVDPGDTRAASDVVIVLKPEHTISGVVVDKNGKPVKGAQLQIGRPSHALQTAKTDRRGEFVLGKLDEETYQIAVIKRGYPVQESQPIPAGTRDARIVLRKAARVSGRVVDDATDRPVRSFNVRFAFPKVGKAASVSKRLMTQGVEFSDRKGRFTIRRNLDPQSAVRLIVVAPGYAVGELDGVRPGVPAEVRLSRAHPLTVRVTDAKTGETVDRAKVCFYYGTRAEGFPRYWLASRHLANVALPPFEAEAAGDGRYVVSQVGEGHWAVEVTADGYSRYAERLDDEAGPELGVKLTRGSVIAGVLRTVAGIRPEQTQISFYTDTTGVKCCPEKDGTFVLDNVPPGDGRLSLSRRGTAFGVTWPLEIAADRAADLEIDLSEFFVLTGQVTRNGTPAARVFMTASGGEGVCTAQARTDGEGRFRLFLRKPGTYNLNLESPKGKLNTAVEVTKKEQALDLALLTGSISGSAADRDGSPLKYGTVTAMRKRDDREHTSLAPWRTRSRRKWSAISSGRTDERGRFTVTGLRAGLYQVVASTRDSGRRAASEPVSLAKDGEHVRGVHISLADLGGVDVVALDAETGAPIEPDSIMLFGEMDVSAHRLGKPRIPRIGDVRPGAYELYVSSHGYQSAIFPHIVVRANERVEVTARLKSGGLLAITMKRSVTSDDLRCPRFCVVLKNLPAGEVAVRQTYAAPNVVLAWIDWRGGQNPTTVRSSIGEAIAPGEYAATVYYVPSQNPTRRAEVHFKVEAGKTAEIDLDEDDMEPVK